MIRFCSAPILVLATVASACTDAPGGDIQDPPAVAAVTVTAPQTTVEIGQNLQLTATAWDDDGNVLEGRATEWITASPEVASVSQAGLVTGVAQGEAEIRATIEGIVGQIALAIVPLPPAAVATVTVTAPAGSVLVGRTLQLTATARDEDGNILEGRPVEWASTATDVATVSPTGLVAGVVQGEAEVRATIEGVAGSLALVVEPLPPGAVATVTVTASVTSVPVGQTLQLTATARDAGGVELPGRLFLWTTADPGAASVSETGLVTGVAPGDVEIRATAEGVGGGLVITVLPTGNGVGLREVAVGLAFPLYLTSPPDDDRLFIVEKGGAIRLVKGGVLVATPFLVLAGRVSTGSEQGLLGLAFPPDYASSGRFVVHYTDLAGDTRVSFFRVSGDPDRADASSEAVLLAVDQPFGNHNGGQITFGPDGFLYIGLGDGGSAGDPDGRGQRLDDLLGSILRIDVSGGAPYSVPLDNPFIGTAGARPEIWSYGLRNPWRFSFDRATGDLYIGDVGQQRFEEVDYSPAAAGAGRGLNYGWNRMEGEHCYPSAPCDRTGLTLPVLEYAHASGCSVTGGYTYRGRAIPALQGQYLYADFCRGWVRSFRAGDPSEQHEWPTLEPGSSIPSFGEDAVGELYVLTVDGRVLKIVPQ